MRHKRRWLALLVLLLLVLSLPFLLNLDFLLQGVRQGLEQQLGREVEMASLTGQLLPRPSVVGRRVRIFEATGFGAEPFLSAEEVRCDLPLRLLWTRRWRCAEIHFLRPSINLVRNSEQAWNVGSFFLPEEPLAEEASTAETPPPVLSVTEGRINFKLGADKQVFALTEVKLRAQPLPGRGWHLQLEAVPVRTDRRLSETGRLRLEGEIGQATQFAAVPFRFQAGLDQGSLAQLIVLALGEEPPLRGQASFEASLEGTPAQWDAQVRLTFSGLRHLDLLPSPRTSSLQGEFDLRVTDGGETIEVKPSTIRLGESEFSVTGQVRQPFGQRQWDLEVSAEQLHLEDLMDQWVSLKAGVPKTTRLRGTARLVLHARGPVRAWEGELTAAEEVRLDVPGLSLPLEFAGLHLRFRQGRLELEPLELRFSPEDSLTVAGEWRLLEEGRPFRLQWRSEAVGLEWLQPTAAALGWNLWAPARWQGRAQFDLTWRGAATAGRATRWEGEAELRNAEFYPPELNQPLEISQAHLRWARNRVRVEPLLVSVGQSPVTGTLERQAGAGPWKVEFSARALRLVALDELVNPARRGLLERLVGGERQRRWERLEVVGVIRVEELVAGPFRLEGFQAEGRLAGKQLELSRLRFRAWEGQFRGRLEADFRRSPPQYRLAGNLKRAQLTRLLADGTDLGSLFSGMVGADLSLQTSGSRAGELLRRLQGRVIGVVHDGAIAHINLLAVMAATAGVELEATEDTPTTELESLAGEFLVADQQVELDGARMIVDGAALELSGRVGFDARLNLELTGEPLQGAGRPVPAHTRRMLAATYHLLGTLRRPQVKLGEPPPAIEETSP